MVIGSIYLGVDVQAMAVGILEKADIEVPAILNTETPGADATTEQAATANANTEVNVSDNNDQATVEDSVTDSAVKAEPTSGELPATPLTEIEQRAATMACWTSFEATIESEARLRTKPIRDAQNWELFDYLLHRKQGHEKVVEAIEQLDLRGVDERLQAHIQQMLAWHQTGFDLFDRAAHLLTDGPSGKLSGPFAQSWQSAATQHRMEEKLILNKHASIDAYLMHTFKTPAAK